MLRRSKDAYVETIVTTEEARRLREQITRLEEDLEYADEE